MIKFQRYAPLLLLLIILACQKNVSPAAARGQINKTLNDWHNAASEADFDRYFSHFASDSAIYMGTDATERWTVPEFKAYAKPHFDKGEAWDFTPTQRHVYIGPTGQTAWFDEVLGTPNLGPARGTGILIRQDTTWKISHYNLSIPIPNAIADTVVKQVDEALNDTTSIN